MAAAGLMLPVMATLMAVVIGAALAGAAAQALRSQLMGVAPTDALSFAVPITFLFAIALLACVIPARRATRLDPVRALRLE